MVIVGDEDPPGVEAVPPVGGDGHARRRVGFEQRPGETVGVSVDAERLERRSGRALRTVCPTFVPGVAAGAAPGRRGVSVANQDAAQWTVQANHSGYRTIGNTIDSAATINAAKIPNGTPREPSSRQPAKWASAPVTPAMTINATCH